MEFSSGAFRGMVFGGGITPDLTAPGKWIQKSKITKQRSNKTANYITENNKTANNKTATITKQRI